MYEFERRIQLREQSAVIYDKHLPKKGKKVSTASLKNLNNSEQNRKNGYMSKATARKVRRIGENWLYALHDKAKRASGNNRVRKPVFITLTLPSPQIHSDKQIRKVCFNDFVKELKRKFKVKNYLQVSEMQKNGNLHFHLIVDAFCEAQETQRLWNLHINRLGYVDRYRQKFDKLSKSQYIKYMKDQYNISRKKAESAFYRQKAIKFSNPNSTRVEAPRKVKSITGYLTKYVSKNVEAPVNHKKDYSAACTYPSGKKVINCDEEVFFQAKEGRKLDGRIWSCSREIIDLRYMDQRYSECFLSDESSYEVVSSTYKQFFKYAQQNDDIKRIYKDEFFCFIYFRRPLEEILADIQHPLIIDLAEHNKKNFLLAYA